MTDLALERKHQMIPMPGTFKTKVIVVVLHNLPVIIHLLPDGKLPNPQGDETETGPAPTTKAWGKGSSLREVVGAKYASVCL
jgi:hypothetical protein